MSSIKHLLVTSMMDVLIQKCITEVPVDDVTRVDGVYLRSAGADVAKKEIVLVIRHFDPVEPSQWRDTTSGDTEAGKFGMKIPHALIGGITTEQIRGTVEANANLTRKRTATVPSDQIIQEVLARAKHALRNASFLGMKDTYGEWIFHFLVTGGTEYDSGSENSNTTRDFLRWTAWTMTAPRSTP